MERITVMAHINTFSGYGQATCAIINGLVQSGYDVNVRSIKTSVAFGAEIPIEIVSRFVTRPQQEEWEFLMSPPDFRPTPRKKTAYFTMWESSRLSEQAVEYLNMSKLVITPSHWNAACFSAAGVTAPIRVVPLGIDDSIFKYQARPNGKACVFGTAGRMAHGGARKGMNEVISAFLKAFPKDQFPSAILKVKGFVDCDIEVSDDSRVQVLRVFLSDPEMAHWLSTLDCFVSGAKGEGWGLLQHQAMACGRPVIASKYGGLAEFMESGNSYPIKFKLNPARLYYDGLGVWAEPDEEDMMEKMRDVYYGRDEAMDRGFVASKSVRHLTWKNTVKCLVEVFKEFGIVKQ